MLLTVIGTDLPGRTCASHTCVRVGVQRGRDAEQWFPAGADAARWTLEVTAKDGTAGPDVCGPHVQGRPGARFVYLVWTGVDAAGSDGMFRRLKVPLDLTAPVLRRALLQDTPLTVALSLSALDRTPRCGGLKTADVRWRPTGAPGQTGTT